MLKKENILENWGYPNTVWFGNGRIKDLTKACKALGIKKPLLVTDKDLAKTKMVEEALEINKKANLPTIVFSIGPISGLTPDLLQEVNNKGKQSNISSSFFIL